MYLNPYKRKVALKNENYLTHRKDINEDKITTKNDTQKTQQ